MNGVRSTGSRPWVKELARIWVIALAQACSGQSYAFDSLDAAKVTIPDASDPAPDDAGAQGDAGAQDDGAQGEQPDPHPSDATTAIDAPADTSSPSDAPRTPSVPPNGLVLWLSADEGVVEGGNRVASWRDRSGKVYDASQKQQKLRPTLAPSWRGGLPAVAFDGEAFLDLPAGFGGVPEGLSIYVVGDAEGPGCPSFVHFSNGGEAEDISLHLEDNGAFMYEVADQTLLSSTGAAPRGQPLLLGVVHRPATDARLFSGGNAAGNAMMNLPTESNRSQNYVGNTTYALCGPLKGHIAEVIVHRRSLETAERTAMEAYLRAKWSL